MSTLPRALHRARLWTTGLLTASTVVVGALGFHLADAHAQSLATRTSSVPSDDSGSAGRGSDDGTGSDLTNQGSSSGFSNSGLSNQGQSNSGFSSVGPVGGSGFQPQTNSGGS